MTRALRVLFVVQGEGRGHMTQALALRELLAAHGHSVCGVLVGRSEGRTPPAFFTAAFDVPVVCIDAPNFAYEGGAVRLGRTVRWTARRSLIYAHTLRIVQRQIKARQPDVVVNFYEGMVALSGLVSASDVPVVCVGHQYMFHHPAYRFASGQRFARAVTKAYTRLTAAGAVQRLALSFYPAADLPEQGITVVPPLLRRAVRALDGSEDDGFFLVYLLNAEMATQVERWHRHRRNLRLECFWDGEAYQPHPNLNFHPLCGERFLQMMARSRGVVCTAGFESISEALWLGKPVYMIPTSGHVEQRTNALDAFHTGAGLFGARFDLDDFLAYLETRPATDAHHRFREWVERGEARIVRAIEAAAHGASPAHTGAHAATPTRLAAAG